VNSIDLQTGFDPFMSNLAHSYRILIRSLAALVSIVGFGILLVFALVGLPFSKSIFHLNALQQLQLWLVLIASVYSSSVVVCGRLLWFLGEPVTIRRLFTTTVCFCMILALLAPLIQAVLRDGP